MNPKLCACITETNIADCIRVAHASRADLLEHRIDFLENDAEELSKLCKSVKLPVIATVRSKKCGGKFTGSENERAEHLMHAIEAGVAMVDVELEMDEQLKRSIISKAKAHGCKVILSMHDFQKTPSKNQLLRIMNEEMRLGADIGKIVTTANSDEDCERVLSLLAEAEKQGFPLIAFAMGERGRSTRVKSLLLGAPFMYCSVGGKAGPGQLSISEMRRALRLMVVGDPVDHSLSPAMHNAALKVLGLEKINCSKRRASERELSEIVAEIRQDRLLGVNVTIPHKQAILKHLDELTKEAELIGAVNTVFKQNGKVVGHNTDGIGCIHAIEEKKVSVKGKKVVLLGAGGAARAVAAALALNDAREVVILNRSAGPAEKLAEDIREKTGSKIRTGTLSRIDVELKNAQILINCTSVGMKGISEGETLVNAKQMHKGLVVMDIVYNPLKTRLLEDAENAGCKTINGVGMLVHQGAAALEKFTGRTAPVPVMREAVICQLAGKTNIALIGFMGTGKTEVGKLLAAKLGKKFVETDELVVKRAGKSISRIFLEDGEEKFRELEGEAVKEAAKGHNAVISCGGGAVLRKENVVRLRKNSRVVLLEASAETISGRTKGNRRPLLNSENKLEEIKGLLRKRRKAYSTAADVSVRTDGASIPEVTERVSESVST